jgi:filamentous hemagglutinin family protein
MANEKAEVTYSDQSEGKNTANTVNADDDSQIQGTAVVQPRQATL